MKSKSIKLIKIMLECEGWVTASFLAAKLNVSERSIKNYIVEINEEYSLITSSRKGYMIDAASAKKIMEELSASIPQTSAERVNYIIESMFKNDALGYKTTDMYQIADEIFVSYETIKKDMAKVRKKLLDFDLFLNNTNSFVSIDGKELDKRKLLSHILYEEFNQNVMSLEVIEKVFPNYDLELLKSIIINQCKIYHYFINEYAVLNLLLDIVIGIDRIKKEKTFGNSRKEGNRFGIREQQLAQNIAAEIEKNFEVSYSQVELEELTIILLSYLMKMDFHTIDEKNIELVVGKECIDIMNKIGYLLKDSYFIDMENQDFLIKFTLHIKNLLIRLKNGYTTKNPLMQHIKNTCPLIFECAVDVADKIEELTGYKIKEDEIAYIALHIGGNLETIKHIKKVVSCIILFPQYYDFSGVLLEKLREHFGKQIEIKTVITSIDQIKKVKRADLVISTIPVYETIRMEWVMITPFLKDKDLETIKDKIDKINLSKKKARLKKHLMQISNPEFFYKNQDFASKEEAVRFMTDIMEKEGYVSQTFYQDVFSREKQASTAFEHIAVPHSMRMDAKHTGMFVLLNEKKPIEWNHDFVSIVLLFAINKEERAVFHDVYDNLIVSLLEKTNAVKVTASNTYIEFIEAVVGCVE